jgi:YesN/AraC family two-component response regulator
MEIRNLYQPFELELLETNQYHARAHRNTFFEMVFVLEGEGNQIINENRLPFGPNKLFLIFPQDKHSFEIEKHSRFFFIRFNDSYLGTQGTEWIQAIEYIFHSHNHMPGCILKTITDKPLVRAMVEALIREQLNEAPQQDKVTSQLINTVITIAARNITIQDTDGTSAKPVDGFLPMINYVHQYIYQPEKLRVEALSEAFHISPTYVGEYFKKSTGESLQSYIGRYKIRLIKTRLQYTGKRISEIAYEFGFADESHLHRTFKKHTGIGPSSYRKEYQSSLGSND